VLFLLAHSRRPLSLLAVTVGWAIHRHACGTMALPSGTKLASRVAIWCMLPVLVVTTDSSPAADEAVQTTETEALGAATVHWQQQVLVGVCYGVHDLCFQAGGSHAPPIVAAARAGCFMCTCWHHGLLRSLL
jgi:hypothetical protein